jgi:hypothetical protein
LPAFEVLIT